MVQYCCVPQCNSRWKPGAGIKFHTFPKDSAIAKDWCVRLRSGKAFSKSHRVCSLHFKEEDYEVTSMGCWKILKAIAVPSQKIPERPVRGKLLHKGKPGDHRLSRLERYSKRIQATCVSHAKSPTQDQVATFPAGESGSITNTTVNDSDSFEDRIIESSNPANVDDGDSISKQTATQQAQSPQDPTRSPVGSTNMEQDNPNLNQYEENNETGSELVECKSVGNQTHISLKMDKIISGKLLNSKQLKYFAGVNTKRFYVLLNIFTLHETLKPCELSIDDQFLLTLCKYRHDLDFTMLGILFDTSRHRASQIVRFWSNMMYLKLKSINFWSTNNPDENVYSAIIDCTEIPIESSSDPIIHQLTFSTYKNRNTFKALVAISETGVVLFCSDLYGGSISDKQIVIESKFVDYLDEGSAVLADKGFDISDLFEKKKICLNIPAFKVNNKLSANDREMSKALSSKRIHVERLFALAKLNKIISNPMPPEIWPIANKVFFNCIMMCNLKGKIV